MCQILKKETRQQKLDLVPLYIQPIYLFRLIVNPIVFSMNVELELFPFTYSTPLPLPFNTIGILLILYARRWVYLFRPSNPAEQQMRTEKKKEKKLSGALVRTVLKFKCSTPCVLCNMRVHICRRCYLVKSSCHL